MRPIGTLVPAGFSARAAGRRTLLAREDLVDRVLAAGLFDPAAWQGLVGAGPAGPGRGASGRLVLPGGVRLVVKRMRRGGWAASLWRDRFAGTSRLLRNLSVPIEASRRGVPTAAPAAMLTEQGPPGLYRAWLAVEEIRGAEDLLTRWSRPAPPGEAEVAEVLRTVRRMHDAGVDHRDLNLGNLLVRAEGEGVPETYVVDLDGARLHDGPLPVRKRRAALLRMERSYLKRFGDRGPLGAPRGRMWAEGYSEGDPALARALSAGNLLARLTLAIHRAGWGTSGPKRH
jgi:hypothetical protein